MQLKSKSLILCGLFASLITVGAFIKIPIPFVPFTLQLFFTILAGLLLGKKYGSISVGIYLLIGLMGFPIFTRGGGIGYIFQPTFGYLIGFLLGAYLAGYISETSSLPPFKKAMVAGLAAMVVCYTLGMMYYYFISKYYLGTPVGAKFLMIYCCLLTLPGDIFSCILSAALYKRLSPNLARLHS